MSYVNAPLLASERGTAVRLVTDPESPDHRNLITIRGTLADGSQVSVSGTLVGIHHKERLVEVNGFDLDIEPTEHLAFLVYQDRPGMVGTVGRILGDADINIAGMQVSRDRKGGKALVALNTMLFTYNVTEKMIQRKAEIRDRAAPGYRGAGGRGLVGDARRRDRRRDRPGRRREPRGGRRRRERATGRARRRPRPGVRPDAVR